MIYKMILIVAISLLNFYSPNLHAEDTHGQSMAPSHHPIQHFWEWVGGLDRLDSQFLRELNKEAPDLDDGFPLRTYHSQDFLRNKFPNRNLTKKAINEKLFALKGLDDLIQARKSEIADVDRQRMESEQDERISYSWGGSFSPKELYPHIQTVETPETWKEYRRQRHELDMEKYRLQGSIWKLQYLQRLNRAKLLSLQEYESTLLK